jgi:anti-sigma regulatory factor (Ser/Thr protein kinase)
VDLDEAPGVVLLQQRCRDQEIAIERLMEEAQSLRAENADLVTQLEAARGVPAVANGVDRLEASLPIGPAAPATARAALTRWLSGHVPRDVLENARLLASELVTNSIGHADLSGDSSLRIAVQLSRGALRVEVRDPGSAGVIAPRQADRVNGGGFGLHLVELLSTRWGVNRTGGTHVWFEMDATGATD